MVRLSRTWRMARLLLVMVLAASACARAAGAARLETSEEFCGFLVGHPPHDLLFSPCAGRPDERWSVEFAESSIQDAVRLERAASAARSAGDTTRALEAGGAAMVYARFLGRVGDPLSAAGQRYQYERGLTVERVLEMRPPRPDDCR